MRPLQCRLGLRSLRQWIGRRDRHPEFALFHHLHESRQNRPVETREDGCYSRAAVRDRTRAHAARPQVGGGVQNTLADTIQHGIKPVGRQSPDAIGTVEKRYAVPVRISW